MGMFQPAAPAEYGGGGLDFLPLPFLWKKYPNIAKGCITPGCEAFGHGVNPILYAGTEEQIEKYLKACIRNRHGAAVLPSPNHPADRTQQGHSDPGKKNR